MTSRKEPKQFLDSQNTKFKKKSCDEFHYSLTQGKYLIKEHIAVRKLCNFLHTRLIIPVPFYFSTY